MGTEVYVLRGWEEPAKTLQVSPRGRVGVVGADVPARGWRRGSPIPAVLLAPAAPETKNSTFTLGQPYESRPRTPPQQGLGPRLF